jgi:hypothetical protein
LKGPYRQSEKTVIKKNEEKMNQAGIKKLISKGEGISIEFKECRKLVAGLYETLQYEISKVRPLVSGVS